MDGKPDSAVIHLTAKKIFIIMVSLQLALLGLIGLNRLGFGIPILRQAIGFVYLTFVPGFLILKLLNINSNNLETFLYSVGLSLSFLMFTGAVINFLYPLFGITKPISEIPLIVTISIIVSFLSLLCYLRNRNSLMYFSSSMNEVFCSKVLFLLFLPIFSIIGAYTFNLYDSNVILLILLLLISLAPLLVVFNKIPKDYYPVAIWSLSLSLLFHRSLVVGFEPSETIFPGIIKVLGRWDASIYNSHNSLLPNVILFPSMFSILDVSTPQALKIIPPFIISFIPLILYQIFQRVISEKEAFFSAFLYMSMFPFYRSLIAALRTGMAIFFLSLLMLVAIDEKVSGAKKSLLSTVFAFFLITSHYATSYFFMYAIGISAMFALIWRKWSQNNEKLMLLSSNFTALYLAMVISWYMYSSSSSGFNLLISFSSHVLTSISEFMSPEASYSAYVLQKEWPSLTIEILKYLYLIISIFIGIGLLAKSYDYFVKKRNNTFNSEYLFFSIAFTTLILATFLPTAGFNTARVLMITLVLLAPFFVLGIRVVIEFLRFDISNKHIYVVLALFLMIFLLLNSGFISETVLKDYAPSAFISKNRIMKSNDINAKTYLFKEEYKSPEDFLASAWILTRGSPEKTVYGDHFMIWQRLRYRLDYVPEYNLVLMGKEKPTIKLLEENTTVMNGDYIILGYHNLKEGILIKQYYPSSHYYSISAIHSILVSSNKIYTNSGSEIYYR